MMMKKIGAIAAIVAAIAGLAAAIQRFRSASKTSEPAL